MNSPRCSSSIFKLGHDVALMVNHTDFIRAFYLRYT